MKTCAGCGLSNQDENLFCIHCGKSLSPEPSTFQPEVYSNTPPQEYSTAPAPYTYGQAPESFAMQPVQSMQANPNAMENIRRVIGSSMLLAVIILWFSQIAVSLLFAFSGAASFTKMIPSSEWPWDMSVLETIDGYFQLFLKASSVYSAVFSVLLGIGMIMQYRSARDAERPMKSGGVRLIRGLLIYQLASVCLMIAALMLISVACISGAASEAILKLDMFSSDESTITSVIQFMGVVFFASSIIAGSVMILFNVLILKFLGSIKKSVETGWVHERFATFAAVLAFIAMGSTSINVLSSLTTLVTSPAAGAFSLVTSAISAVIYGLLGALVMKYKKAVYSWQ